VRVLINATSARLGGGITVLRNLLPALCAEDGGRHRYTVVARPEVRPQLGGEHPRVEYVTPSLGEPIYGRLLWEQLALPLRAAFGQADLLFSPANLAIFGIRMPQVLMVQNLAPFDPDVISRCEPGVRRRMRALRELGILSARLVDRVVFISEFARRRLVPLFHIPAARAACIHLGRDPAFAPGAAAGVEPLLEQRGVKRPFLLSVGQFYPYKNLVELVAGFSRARDALPPEVTLVLAGATPDEAVDARVRAVIAREELEDRVKVIGEVPYDQLPGLYASCALFLFPSACENFPNILVEGLSSGAPTLCSEMGPMPEVAGEGASYFDPFDPDAIAAAIVRLFHDPAAQERLRAAGQAQAARYSWGATARGLLEVFAQAAG
jgi:glycosyltransferase involved in cell wall biosynthesis